MDSCFERNNHESHQIPPEEVLTSYAVLLFQQAL